MTLSLLRALDSTGHDVDLRCLRPPQNASFCGGDGGGGGGGGGGRADCNGDGDGAARAAGRPAHEFRHVRLRRAPPGRAPGGCSPAPKATCSS